MGGLIPVYQQKLPKVNTTYYDKENQLFLYSYENGGLMVTGNNMSVGEIELCNVIFDLSKRIEALEYRLDMQESATTGEITNGERRDD